MEKPEDSLVYAEKLRKRLTRTVQAMQIHIWAAFKGCVVADQELKAVEMKALSREDLWQRKDEEEEVYMDIHDEELQAFLEMEEDGHQEEPDLHENVTSTEMNVLQNQ